MQTLDDGEGEALQETGDGGFGAAVREILGDDGAVKKLFMGIISQFIEVALDTIQRFFFIRTDLAKRAWFVEHWFEAETKPERIDIKTLTDGLKDIQC